MKNEFFVLAFLFFLLAGIIEQPESSPQENFLETIRVYNGLLADGYRRQNMNHLVHAATRKKVMKAYYHMAALGEGGVRMDSSLRNLEFVSSKHLSPDKAEVTCKERWEYKYINTNSGKTSDLLTVNYTSRYRLIKGKEKWLVDGVTILYTDRANDSDVLSFIERPANAPPGSVPSKKNDPISNNQDEPGN